MAESCKGSGSQSGNELLGPDLFGFCSRAIVNLFAQREGALSFCSERLDCVGKESAVPKKNDLINTSLGGYQSSHDYKTAGPVSLFSDAIGPQLSDFAKERIKALVRQSLFSFSKEVDSIVEAVLGICRLQSTLRYKEILLKHHEAPRDDNTEHWKRQKVLPSVEVDADLRFILDTESSKVEQLVKKHSDQILSMIEHMKQKLDDFLDLLLSYFRSMTLAEKQKLQKLIQNLPPENLDRVVEIIQRGRPCTDEVHVDLEEQVKLKVISSATSMNDAFDESNRIPMWFLVRAMLLYGDCISLLRLSTVPGSFARFADARGGTLSICIRLSSNLYCL